MNDYWDRQIMAELILQNVSRIHKPDQGPEVRAVQDFSLEIRKGELMVLVGPSGCGKTSLLRLIAGLDDADSGSILIGGQMVNKTPPGDRDVAMVFQNYALFPHLTVRDNLGLGLKFRRVPLEEVDRRVSEAARLLHLEDALDRKPRELSGGQRQRTALGRALVRRPQVFLLDEPLSNLDARMRTETRMEIARLHANLRATMLYVTHDQTEAMMIGERLCVMNQGRIMQVGSPPEVYDRPRNLFVAGFIGSPGMNLIPGRILDEEGGLIFRADASSRDGATVPLPANRFRDESVLAGKEVILGIRPENIEVATADSSAVGRSRFPAKVDLRESLGHEALLHLTAGRHVVIARVTSTERFSTGQDVLARIDPDRVRLFDPGSNDAIHL